MASLDKSMQNAVDSYGDKITTLTSFVEAVRQVPGMYLGQLGAPGLLTAIREIFQNSIDQMILDGSPCKHIYLHYDMNTHIVIVEDDGLGLPFDDMVRILTEEHTSKNYTKNLGEYSSGRHGVGAKVVNALSTYFNAESYHYSGQARRLEMVEGYPTTKKPFKIPNPKKKQGTRIEFLINEDILGHNIVLGYDVVYRLIKVMLSGTPLGSVVDFEAVDLEGNVHQEHIVNKDGIITDLIMKMKSPMIKPIILSQDTGVTKVDLAFCYDATSLENGSIEPDITAFSNFCPTLGGTHIEGFLNGLTSWFVSYMNKVFLATDKRSKTKVIANDIKTGLNAVIFAAHLEPNFTGQAKEIISNEDFLPFVKGVVVQGLDEWSKNNPQDLQKLAKYFKEIADIRLRSEKEKVKIVNNYQSNLVGYPAKYKRPEKVKKEFIICEGDSAAGSIKDGRDRNCQGVFPIRGKMPNSFSTTPQKFWNNAEVQGIQAILFDRKPYKRNFDPVKDCKWEKIIFMADADIDGGHICVLLLRFFLMYYPQLIEAGKVYKSVPPLYGITQGKKTTYFTDRIDIVRYVQKFFVKENSLAYNGKSLTSKELTLLFARNEDYLYEVNCIADRYRVAPQLLELALVNYINNTSPASLKKAIKGKYRFMDVRHDKKYNIDIVDGIVGNKSNTLYLGDKLISECKNIIDIIESNDHMYYELNGEVTSMYDVMVAYDKASPKNLQRYKGLGEMSYQKLAESALLPTSDRTLIQYTLQDAKEELEAIRVYESDTKKILKHINTISRNELIGL